MKLEEEQKKLDEEKWLKSEREGRDVCGEFDYCKLCDKSLANPCATALNKEKKSAKKTPVAAVKKAVEAKKVAKKAPAKKVAKKSAK